eukprot:3678651-Pyramimonas_sp.AAC.1
MHAFIRRASVATPIGYFDPEENSPEHIENRLKGGGGRQWATVVVVVPTMPVEIVALPLALRSLGDDLASD